MHGAWASAAKRVRQLFENGMLTVFGLEDQARARYVDLDGESAEYDQPCFRSGSSASGDRRVYVAMD